MIVAVARSRLSASFGRHPWGCVFGEPLIPLPPSQLRRNFPRVRLLPLPQPHPQHMPRAMPAWDGEGPVIRSFTILRDAAVCGWLRKQPLLCRCTGNTLRSLRVVPSSRSWHQTGTNRKGQASPSELAEARACFSSSPVPPGSFHGSQVVSHCCRCIAFRYRRALVSSLFLSRVYFSRTAAFGCTVILEVDIGCWIEPNSFW